MDELLEVVEQNISRVKNTIEYNKKYYKQSSDFEQIMQVESNGVPGFISEKTQFEILEYMKKLEWKIEELEVGTGTKIN